jgi:hypothetical protein
LRELLAKTRTKIDTPVLLSGTGNSNDRTEVHPIGFHSFQEEIQGLDPHHRISMDLPSHTAFSITVGLLVLGEIVSKTHRVLSHNDTLISIKKNRREALGRRI